VARIRSAAAYEGPLERALHRFKYENWRVLAPTLATLMLECWPNAVSPSTPVMALAVPLHRRRERERGYNQSQLLAEELRRRWALGAAPGSLVRLRDTPPQVGLDRPSRRRNVAGAFGWEGPDLAGRDALLVDDVATTGSTLEACGQALKAAGAGRIEAVTVARVSA
jgi:ComF family protein